MTAQIKIVRFRYARCHFRPVYTCHTHKQLVVFCPLKKSPSDKIDEISKKERNKTKFRVSQKARRYSSGLQWALKIHVPSSNPQNIQMRSEKFHMLKKSQIFTENFKSYDVIKIRLDFHNKNRSNKAFFHMLWSIS